jgi:hypothetical protein
VSLKQVFKSRIDRAGCVLENPEAGPMKICFSSVDLSDSEKLNKPHKQFPSKKPGVIYLYQLSFEGEEVAFASRARAAFRQVRANNTCNMSRDNEKHPNSLSLYVGTSENLNDRFRTHLGRGKGIKTWALYLSKWAAKLETTFVVEYYKFTETVAEDVELIEGILWDSLRPLFGKKGGK